MLFKKVRSLEGAKKEVVGFLGRQGIAEEDIEFTELTGPHHSPRRSGGKGQHYDVSAKVPGTVEGIFVVYEDGYVDGHIELLQ